MRVNWNTQLFEYITYTIESASCCCTERTPAPFFGIFGLWRPLGGAWGLPIDAFQGQWSMVAQVTEEAFSEDAGNSGEDGG